MVVVSDCPYHLRSERGIWLSCRQLLTDAATRSADPPSPRGGLESNTPVVPRWSARVPRKGAKTQRKSISFSLASLRLCEEHRREKSSSLGAVKFIFRFASSEWPLLSGRLR